MSHDLEREYIVYNTSTDKFLFFKEKDHFGEPFSYEWFDLYELQEIKAWVLVATSEVDRLNHDLIDESTKIISDLRDKIINEVDFSVDAFDLDKALHVVVHAMEDFRMVGYVDGKPDHLDSHEMNVDMYCEVGGEKSGDFIMKVL